MDAMQGDGDNISFVTGLIRGIGRVMLTTTGLQVPDLRWPEALVLARQPALLLGRGRRPGGLRLARLVALRD